MTVLEIINKHKYCDFLVINNQCGERILKTSDFDSIDKNILSKEVKEYHNYCESYTSEDYDGREFVVADWNILEVILYV